METLRKTEILKVVSVWSMFEDADLHARPHPTNRRGRSALEHMVHQSVHENLWFSNMLGISVTGSPLPERENRASFIESYVRHARARLDQLRSKPDEWWEQPAAFFEVTRSRAWCVAGGSRAHRAPSRAADRAAAHARPRPSPHLRSHRRYRRPDAERGARHLAYADLEELMKARLALDRNGETALPDTAGRQVSERP